MLTTMYYYNHYKPYIFKAKRMIKTDNARQVADKAARQANEAATRPDDKKLLLNKTLNRDVVSYANKVSRNLISLKDSAKYINYDSEDFDYNLKKFGQKRTKENLKNNLKSFAEAYNSSAQFYSSQSHSQSLVDFSVRINNVVSSNMDKLSKAGFYEEDAESVKEVLKFNPESFDNMELGEIKESLDGMSSVFKNIYSESTQMLSAPLTEHMNFRNLSYYYNYKYGGVMADTFKVIESGMIVDVTA